jgi:alkylated DNA repair dioxygenase AlkB
MVPRSPSEEPEGLVLRAELLTAGEEAELLERLGDLRFDPIVMHGREARRTARHYGLGYDYESRTPLPGDPVPEWLLPVRGRAADLAGAEPEELVEVLVQRYPPGATIGWHRDAPAFGTVVGVSLGGTSRLRFQRGTGDLRRVWEIALEPRSGYVLAGEARRSWQHSIPPTKELRYSITFRTLRPSSAARAPTPGIK